MTNKKYPKISIITPSYNQGQFLEETILSVLNQDYPNLEYLIIDGGSSDNSVEIIKKYEKHLAYWVSEPDKGQADAINKGFSKCTGDILCWLNSDDVLKSDSLQLVSDFFLLNRDIDCIIGDLEIINERGGLLVLKKSVPFDFKMHLYTACLIPQPATFFTRKVWQETGELDYRLNYQMDYEYFLRMADKGFNFALLRKPLAQFRLHENSKSISDYKTEFFKDQILIQNKYIPKYIEKNKYKKKILRIMKMYYKIKMYLIRFLIRGEFIPFKAAIARRSFKL